MLLSSFRFTPFPNLNFAILFSSSPPTAFETTFVGTEAVIVPTIIFAFDGSFKAPPLIGVLRMLFFKSNGTAPPTRSLLFQLKKNLSFDCLKSLERILMKAFKYIFYTNTFMALLVNHQWLL